LILLALLILNQVEEQVPAQEPEPEPALDLMVAAQ
jgi:hypothetical protein